MAMGKHYGSFAKGFSDSLLAAMRLSMMMDFYKSRTEYMEAHEHYWNAMANKAGKGGLPQGAIDAAKAGYEGWGGGTGDGASYSGKFNSEGAQLVAKELTDRGVKPQVAAGAVAGIMGESGVGLNTGAFNTKDPGGGSGGIGQWNRDRLVGNNGMLAFAKANGVDGIDINNPRDAGKVPLDVQAKYIGYELDHGYNHVLKGLQASNTGEEGLTTWVDNYENPLDKAGAIAQRRQYIQPVTAALQGAKLTPRTETAMATATTGPATKKALVTNRSGKAGQTDADKPTKVATAEEATTTSPDGGFAIPGPPASPATQPSDTGFEHGITDPAQAMDQANREAAAAGKPAIPPAPTAPMPARPVTPTPQPATINAATDTSPYVQPAHPPSTGPMGRMPWPQNEKGETAPGSTPNPANVPAANAQPVSSPAIPPQPVTQGVNQTPGFVQVDRPNLSPTGSGRSGPPQMTAIDLSHLLGPNPPLHQQAATPAPQPGPDRTTLPASVAANPPLPPPRPQDGVDGTVATASRKGGPIQRFARGGIPSKPTLGFAAGGATQNPDAALQYMGGLSGMPFSYNTMNQYANNTGIQNIQFGADWAAMTPAQQQEYNAIYGGAAPPSATPAPTPTPAPAAPTPAPVITPPTSNVITQPIVNTTTVDPTTTTITGTPGVPNAIAPKNYNTNVDPMTGATFTNTSNAGGTNYSVGADDLLQTNNQNQISGNNTTILSRKGGPITPRVKRRVTGYDDGGEVSPSAAGMPPGLSTQGQSPIPPIYFNPATYSPYGAPVGKGITQSSAPTYTAGAIPSLPMALGGVVAFDDGGDVGAADDTAMMQQVSYDDMQDRQFDAEDKNMAATSAMPPSPQIYTPSDLGLGSSGQPSASQPSMGAGGQQVKGQQTPAQQIMPTITDGQGNPSKGLIAAIGDGLHWLGDHLGLVGGAQAHPAIATDPQIQTNRMNVANKQNVGGLTSQQMEAFKDMQDPHHQLEDSYRTLAGMEGAYKWLLSQNMQQEAGQMAASMLQYSVVASQNFSEQAAKELYDGNLQGAVDNINKASDAVPDGRTVHAELSPDGKTITVTGSDLSGRALWQKQGEAQAILEHATALGRTGKLQWDALESQAAKYNSTFAEMRKARQGNEAARAKEIAANQSESRIAAAGANTPLAPIPVSAPSPAIPSTPQAQPAAAQPASVVAGAAEPGSSADSTGTAAPRQPPSDTDSNIMAKGPTGHGGALPPQPQAGNVPPQDAQPVSFEDVVNRIDQQESQANQTDYQRISGKYVTPQGNIIYGGQQYARPTPPNLQGLNPAEQRQASAAWKVNQLDPYNAMVTENQKAMTAELNEAKDMRSKQFTTLRDAAKERFTEQGKRETMTEQEKLVGMRSQDEATRQQQQQERGWQHAEQEPMSRKELDETFKDRSPAAYLAGGTGDQAGDTAAAQTLGRQFDLNDRGGVHRINALGHALYNTQAFNKYISTDELADTLKGMANGSYGYRAKRDMVDNGYGPMRQVEVFGSPKLEGPSTTILMPARDYDNISNIQGEFKAAKQQPPPIIGMPPQPTIGDQPSFGPGP